MHLRRAVSVVVWAGLGLCALALAGPLDPPPGPVSDTGANPALRYKTLGEVEPRTSVQSLPGSAVALYVISQPGSYYLTANVTAAAGKHGIVIASDHVSLDLNGFALLGSASAGDGISLGDAARYYKNVEIRNGVIRGWAGSGVNMQIDNGRIENLRVSNCSLAGISTGTSNGMVIRGNTVADCVAGGIFTGNAALVEGNTVVYAGTLGDGPGIAAADGSTIRGNTVRAVRDTGIFAGGQSIVEGNLVWSAKGDGINIGQRTLARLNNVSGSTGSGIVIAGQQCTVTDNTLTANAAGSTTNGGIVASNQNSSRIENNSLVGNGVGIRVTGTGNYIVRNTARQNTNNYSFGSGNAYGPIVVINLIGDISTSANVNNAHPLANFSH